MFKSRWLGIKIKARLYEGILVSTALNDAEIYKSSKEGGARKSDYAGWKIMESSCECIHVTQPR